MHIYKRPDTPTPAWEMMKQDTGRQGEIACTVKGTWDEHLLWLNEQNIKEVPYRINNMYFFTNETEGLLFFMKWA